MGIKTSDFVAKADLEEGVSGRAPMNTRFENTREDYINEPKLVQVPEEDDKIAESSEGSAFFEGVYPLGVRGD